MLRTTLASCAIGALLLSSAAFAQAPPAADAQTKTDKEGPTTMGGGAPQPADPTVGQKPPTDPESKLQSDSPTTSGSTGAGSGEEGADATPGQRPATDAQSKKQNESPTTE